MKKRVLAVLSLFISISISMFSSSLLSANEDEQDFDVKGEVGSRLSEDHVFTTMDKDGNIIEVDIRQLEEETKKEQEAQARMRTISTFADIRVGVVNFKTKSSANLNTNYTEETTGRSGYMNGYYAADGAFLGYNSDRSKVKFMQAGVIGWVNANEVQVLDYYSSQVNSVNFYRSEGGVLYHYGTNNVSSSYYSLVTQVGLRQSYMQDNVVYYSYDGHYFYKTYEQMINDYKANTRSNSINPNTPYYNYYQYLSHRTKTSFSSANLDAYALQMAKNNTNSKMYKMGQSFIDNQNKYGVNAALAYGVAANESGWGLSSIAQNKNNLFGHAAYDSDPSGSANGYSSPAFSIYYHAKVFVSEGYLDTKDFRYFGSHLGDKASGMNVKYASDPYWGEKAAAISWRLQANYNSGDVNTYTIGIKQKGDVLNVRKEATTDSPVLYQTVDSGDFPFIILAKVNGQSVNGSNVWYKIQSDTTLNADRSALTQDRGEYDFNKDYAYVHSSYVKIVHTGKDSGGSGNNGGNTASLGDVNGDGKISAMDYVLVKNHILKIQILSGDKLARADVNKDGKTSALDYVAIKNHILKISTIN